jgi:hypothetical protein
MFGYELLDSGSRTLFVLSNVWLWATGLGYQNFVCVVKCLVMSYWTRVAELCFVLAGINVPFSWKGTCMHLLSSFALIPSPPCFYQAMCMAKARIDHKSEEGWCTLPNWMNDAGSKKTCMLQSKHALIFILTALCMWHTKGMFIHASQLIFSVKKLKRQKQKQTTNF